MHFKRKYQRRSYVDLTSLIDVLFNLLLFFIITSFIQFSEQGININLPSASESAPLVKNEVQQIAITDKGEVYLNGKAIKDDVELESALRQNLSNTADKILYIKADGDAVHKRVVGVMDLAKKVGFLRLSIGVLKQ